MSDSPWANPFSDSAQRTETLLSFENTVFANAYSDFIFWSEFAVSPRKFLKSRIVYSWITLLSEVSGFADIIIVLPSFILAMLYSGKQKEYQILQNLGSLPPTKAKKQYSLISALSRIT